MSSAAIHALQISCGAWDAGHEPEESIRPIPSVERLAIALAGLDEKEAALREAQQAVALAPISRDWFDRQGQLISLAQVQARIGSAEEAITQVRALLDMPSLLSVPLLKLDPAWDPLRGDARFQALLKKYADEQPAEAGDKKP